LCQLEGFLLKNFYLHPRLQETSSQVRQWLGRLFDRFCNQPDLMPRYFQGFVATCGLQRVVADYIAGMTDRYCMKLLTG
jgi:dGTPase